MNRLPSQVEVLLRRRVAIFRLKLGFKIRFAEEYPTGGASVISVVIEISDTAG